MEIKVKFFSISTDFLLHPKKKRKKTKEKRKQNKNRETNLKNAFSKKNYLKLYFNGIDIVCVTSR